MLSALSGARRLAASRLVKSPIPQTRQFKFAPEWIDDIMAPKADTTADELAFVKLCFQYYKEPMNKGNFNFQEVAIKAGSKDADAAYKRFWSIKKKWGMGSEVAGNAGTPKGKKRSATEMAAKYEKDPVPEEAYEKDFKIGKISTELEDGKVSKLE